MALLILEILPNLAILFALWMAYRVINSLDERIRKLAKAHLYTAKVLAASINDIRKWESDSPDFEVVSDSGESSHAPDTTEPMS